MANNVLPFDAEASLHYIQEKFHFYKSQLDEDQEKCERLIESIRKQFFSTHIELDQIEFVNQLDYFEQEAWKSNEENKICLFQKFQNLFQFHRQFAFDEIVRSERKIGQTFAYRPSVLGNIEQLQSTMSSRIERSISFSKRADIEAFQRKKDSTSIESNEIDLTKLIRESNGQNNVDQLKFSQLIEQNRLKSKRTETRKVSSTASISCEDALLLSGNKRFLLLYNMNVAKALFRYDLEQNELKEISWDEDAILSLGHVDRNLFYLFTSTKIFLYDLIKEQICEQYFLYETLYKDLFLLTNDRSYQSLFKRSNQFQSTVEENFSYYLYLTQDYQQMLIKLSLDDFHQEFQWNLTELFPSVEFFLGFTVVNQSLLTFLVYQEKRFQLLFCDESRRCQLLKTLPIARAIDPTRIVSLIASNLSPSTTINTKTFNWKAFADVWWFILDEKAHCIHCFNVEKQRKSFDLPTTFAVQSLTIVHQDQLVLVTDSFQIEIVQMNLFSVDVNNLLMIPLTASSLKLVN